METKLLEEIGLTEGETKVYLSLLKLGITKTGPLASKANVSSSKVYKILDKLEKKGLSGHIIKGKIKYFRALEPNRIIDYIEDKEKQLQEKKEQVKKLLPELENRINPELLEGEAVVYDGFKACTNFFRNILDELKTNETYYVIGAGYGKEINGLKEFFHNHHKKRSEKNVKVKMLANFDTKDNLAKTTLYNSEIRFLPKYLISNMEIVFYNNKLFIVLWTKQPKGFLIESKEAVKSFETYFKTFWKIAK